MSAPVPPRAALLLTGLALALLPLAQGLPGAPAVAADAHVHIANFAFDPLTVVIQTGQSVDWDNHDLVAHTVTADDASFDSGNLAPGAVYARTFTTPGTISYHCDLHPSMTAQIVVSDPNALPDLVVSAISTADALPGVSKVVNVTVRNLGDAAAGAARTHVGYLYHGAEANIGDFDGPVLGPGASFTGQVLWSTLLKVGDFQVVAHADADGAVAEGDETNNDGAATSSVLLAGVEGIDLLHPL